MTPDEYTISEHFLDVGNGHQVYVHDWGNKKAKSTIMLVKGGPGSSSKDKDKQTFDPTKQHVIFFDQRGSGRSLPLGSLENNTTSHLVNDMVKIAKYCSVDKLVLHGGSWGSTLSLCFAIEHPHMVEAMVLHGIFTATKKELDWLLDGDWRAFYPDVWARYLSQTPQPHQSNPSKFHMEQALDSARVNSKLSAFTFDLMEGSIGQLDDRATPEDFEAYDPTGIRTEIYYMANDCFIPDEHIIKNAHRLTMPIFMIQGRYDMVCPPTTAYHLHEALPDSQLIWTMNGHRPERESNAVMRALLGGYQ